MKKIMNQPETMVLEMCKGLVLANPELELIEQSKVIKKKDINVDKVTLISGGGSGHEPAHAGFVGKGMLDAAICGDIFASPSQIQVYQGIKQTKSNKGTLLIIKNYSGDIMNFRNALYLAEEDGIRVDYVKVDDDIAVENSLYTVGHRGTAGTVLVEQIAGAAAECGKDLEEVKRLAQKTIDRVKTIGFALSSCTVPAKGSPTFSLGEDEIEYGVGIHGEPGIRRENMKTASQLAAQMVEALVSHLDKPEEVVVMINGFGATPLQELYLLNYQVAKLLHEKNISIYRGYVGNYMTSIDMAGASVTLLHVDEELKQYLDMDCLAPGFVSLKKGNYQMDVNLLGEAEPQEETETSSALFGNGVIENNSFSMKNLYFALETMTTIILREEVAFCELDSHAGDGDFGMSIAKGFRQLKKEWPTLVAQHGTSMGEFLQACSMIIMEYCGGASGPIWGSAFRYGGKNVGEKTSLSVAEFAEFLNAMVDGIQLIGERSFGRGAGMGDKTLMDALIPCKDAWFKAALRNTSFLEAFEMGAKEAVAGAKETEKIAARMGRAGTVGERSIGYPDAGAHALGVIFTEVTKAFQDCVSVE
jgi:triose/dihydroxyacetone kinase / FAD-AMP lyase (cyclizing)